MKKRILSMLIACAMIFAMLPTVALAADADASGTCGENAAWSFDAATGTLTVSGTGAMANYYSYGQPWKAYLGQITSVVVEDGITTIGIEAFSDCTALTSVTIPGSVATIGSGAFKRCTALTSVTIPDSVTTIENNAFDGCTSLTSVTIPDSVTTIALATFNGCTSLTSVTIPDSVTSIGNNAFRGCTDLNEVTIPDSVETIGNNVFKNCSDLTSVTIPDSVTSIGSNAFQNCTDLTNVTIPDSVTTIGNQTFSGCTGLTSVTISDSVQTIPAGAFEGCTSLESVTIPDSVTSIKNNAFDGCTDLTSVTILGSETSINSNAFTGCESLTSVNIPASGDSEEDIPDAFEGFTDLTVNKYSYTVMFNLNGHGTSVPDPQYISDKATEPDDPSAEGYIFSGWYTEEACTNAWDFETPVTENITLYAKWTASTYTVTLNANGATINSNDVTSYTYGVGATLPVAADMTKVQHEFKGWYESSDFSGDAVTAISATDTGDKTYYAKWVEIIPAPTPSVDYEPTYSVTIEDVDNGSVKLNKKYAEAGETVTLTVTPDDGYELESLTVTDRNGNEIKLTSKGNGEYTFKMPVGKVEIEAVFAKVELDNPFVDVDKDAYYYDAILWAVENGITGGTSATTFSPAAACTRAQTVTFLWRAAGSPEPETAVSPFEDVDPSAYYYKAVLWAAEQGITGGTSATTFSPDATVTRSQNVTFLWRIAGSPAAEETASFHDVDADTYYHDAVVWAADEAITSGTSATTFSPADPCLRSQIVTFLYRYYVD